jgi:pyruvate dehydrogenase (quinone)
MTHTSGGKGFVEYDDPHSVGMTGIIRRGMGYNAILECDALDANAPNEPACASAPRT